ncbi:Putative phosphatase [Salmonella enterica subsp. arizonae]|uniref:Phosphatase n=1 Tax=Salmonella enterica subsp. arizonae TaxID=59203 RepID=A0A379SZ90_SALER|nr:Putative phosphatase [Salmonella enterica subsp. arizonae]
MPTDGMITLNLEKIMTARVIALDLDGTLLTPQKTLLPSSLDALSRAKEAGFQLIIVTGRHPRCYSSFLSGVGAGHTCYLLQWHLFV